MIGLRQKIASVVSHVEKIDNMLNANRRRNSLNNTDFTIISNNCWGGHVYRRYGLPYKSPTVGMYFFPDEYLHFVQNLEESLTSDFRVTEAKESKYYETLIERKQESVLIGKLSNGVEIVLLHYHSPEEAIEKWNRRCKRVNYNNIILKFSSLDKCTKEHCKAFDLLDYKKKIMFTQYNDRDLRCNVVAKRVVRNGVLIDDTTYYSTYVNLEKFINTGQEREE